MFQSCRVHEYAALLFPFPISRLALQRCKQANHRHYGWVDGSDRILFSDVLGELPSTQKVGGEGFFEYR